MFASAILLSGFLGGAVLGVGMTTFSEVGDYKEEGNVDSDVLELRGSPALEMGERLFKAKLDLNQKGEDVSFVLNVISANKKPVANRFVIEVMDDRGVSVMSPFISSDMNLNERNGRKYTLPFDAILPGGYYLANAKAFFGDENSLVGVAESEIYFSSNNGKLAKISEKEWNENSLTNVAIKNILGDTHE